MLDRGIIFSVFIEEVDSCRIGRISIRDEDDRVFRMSGADRFLHGNDCQERFSVFSDMVCGDLVTLGGNEEKDIVMFPHDLDVGFITCTDFIN